MGVSPQRSNGLTRKSSNRDDESLAAAEANVPATARAQWIIDGFVRNGLVPKGVSLPADLARRVFRSDLFSQARARHGASPLSV